MIGYNGGHGIKLFGARIKVTGGHIGWADRIFVMEKKHRQRLREKFGEELRGKPLNVLDVPDDYGYMDEELIEILKSRVAEYIELPEDF
ncbi:protein tyrosine phosphatase [Saccharibacillus sp. CPCC 101409]|uniref:protein tyrosine phosphatase n=1 Tax=Saccharibacillus sp. CPCC 101409 TaxID=3058041 RepID=UPI0026717A59|nr:protein tyrosine phosphatase [Saccharibacillus sp. CPCC 101409]MDO3412455.1 protein tyrosine phosphatase [Saccharibacillus sp. CPCC 101409]